MLNVEVILTDGKKHIIKDEESNQQIFQELIKYDNTNLFLKDIEAVYVNAKQIIKYKFV